MPTTINAASGSLDKQFNAIEVKCRNGNKLLHWAHTLKEMRSGGIFSGGIDIRKTFVLIDT